MELVSRMFALSGLFLIVSDIAPCSSFLARTFDSDPVLRATSAAKIVEIWGLPTEIHETVSEDGYITQLLRIPNNRTNCRVPTILHHGLLCSSADWLLQDRANALPYLLWKAGFDVWIPSARGAKVSQKHKTLTTNNVKYWKFSMNEIGRYDVPATIDYVLQKSGAAKVNWVGHSMGCAVLHIAFHYEPEYNKKVNRFVSMAPGVYNSRATAIVPRAMSVISTAVHEDLADRLYKGRAMPALLLQITQPFIPLFCSSTINPTARLLCGNFLFLFSGHLSLNIPIAEMVLKRVLTWTPAESSIRAVTHYIRVMKCRKFGYKVNHPVARSIIQAADQHNAKLSRQTENDKLQRIFNLKLPKIPFLPNLGIGDGCKMKQYSLNKTTIPMLLIYGGLDGMVNPQDAEQTLSETGSSAAGITEKILLPHYQHLDFMYAETAQKLAYEPAISFLSQGQNCWNTRLSGL